MAEIFSIGRSGLSVAKKALETTSHNIANANTEGYSRQRVNQVANPPHLKDGLVMGNGADIRRIDRVHDEYVEKRLLTNISEKNYYEARSNELDNVQNIFNEVDNEGLHHILNRFFNSFRELANNPENESVRSIVRDNAQLVVGDFHRIRQELDEAAQAIDLKVETKIKELNEDIKNVAKLNKQIRTLEVTGDEASDLRDQRDEVIVKLAEQFDLLTYEDNRGNFNVQIGNVGTLVTGGETIELAVGKVSKEKSLNNMEGSLVIFFDKRPGSFITHKFQRGQLGASIEVRNNEIQRLQQQIDSIAYEFSHVVNNIHNQGFVNRKIEMDVEGKPSSIDRFGPTTGINFFEEIGDKDEAARNINLSEEVLADLSNIVTSLSPNKVGDNRVAIAISKIQHEKFLDEGNSTLEEELLKSVADIGLKAGKSNIDLEQANGILAQIKSVKERASGVSLDEETTNMIRYQKAYEASARVLKTSGELFDTVLGIMPR